MAHALFLDQASGSTAGSLVGTVIYLAVVVVLIAAYWRIFSKAGQPGWAAIIPIYSTLVLLRVVGRPWWWLLLLLIPLANIVVLIIVVNDLSKSFGHGFGYTLGLLLLSIIFIPVLGFGGSRYAGPAVRA